MGSEGEAMATTITVRLLDVAEVQAVISAACAVVNKAADEQTITRQSESMVDLYRALDTLREYIHRQTVPGVVGA